jgi:hypothetical protein
LQALQTAITMGKAALEVIQMSLSQLQRQTGLGTGSKALEHLGKLV